MLDKLQGKLKEIEQQLQTCVANHNYLLGAKELAEQLYKIALDAKEAEVATAITDVLVDSVK